MLVVGEASGDVHGAQLIKAMLKRDPRLKAYGVGGEELERTDFEILFDMRRLTGMGLIELAGNLKQIWVAYWLLRRILQERKPDLLVLIDFPEFNLRLAKLARSLGIPVLYYISPQIWAWRRGRVRQIARWVDQMAVVFPFEVAFYQRYGVKVTFIGHPLLDRIQVKQTREGVLKKLKLDTRKPTVALLPGSRPSEVSYHLPVMLEAAAGLRKEREIQFVCVRASTVEPAAIEVLSRNAGLEMPVIGDDPYDVIGAADLVWTASGTATLETALLLKPMIVVYRLSWLTYWLARLLVKVEHIGMVNLVAGERIVPELVQADFNAKRIIQESRVLLDNVEHRTNIITKLTQLRERLGSGGAAERVTDLAFGMMA